MSPVVTQKGLPSCSLSQCHQSEEMPQLPQYSLSQRPSSIESVTERAMDSLYIRMMFSLFSRNSRAIAGLDSKQYWNSPPGRSVVSDSASIANSLLVSVQMNSMPLSTAISAASYR